MKRSRSPSDAEKAVEAAGTADTTDTPAPAVVVTSAAATASSSSSGGAAASHNGVLLCVRCPALHSEHQLLNWILGDRAAALGITDWFNTAAASSTSGGANSSNTATSGNSGNSSSNASSVISAKAPCRALYVPNSRRPYFLLHIFEEESSQQQELHQQQAGGTEGIQDTGSTGATTTRGRRSPQAVADIITRTIHNTFYIPAHLRGQQEVEHHQPQQETETEGHSSTTINNSSSSGNSASSPLPPPPPGLSEHYRLTVSAALPGTDFDATRAKVQASTKAQTVNASHHNNTTTNTFSNNNTRTGGSNNNNGNSSNSRVGNNNSASGTATNEPPPKMVPRALRRK